VVNDNRCSKCKDLINGSNEIKFNNRYYHGDCFKCCHCDSNLNGSTNNKLKLSKDGEPMCSSCELSEAKICYVCQKSIVNEEIIIFDKNNYHKDCFNCNECHKSLVDEKNLQKHNSKACCIECFNKHFAERCCECSEPICNGKSTGYNGKSYHFDCFRCSLCNKVISGGEFAEHDSKRCCVECYDQHFSIKCCKCLKIILNGQYINYNDKMFHPNCFRCDNCNKVITDKEFPTHDGKPCCVQCYDEHFSSKCVYCLKSISNAKSIIYNDKKYHEDCFRCGQCDKVMTDSKFHTNNSKPCCNQCYDQIFAPNCSKCLEKISVGKSIIYDKKSFHPDCFRCGECDKVMNDSKFHTANSKPCCAQCYDQYFTPQCQKCLKPINDKYTTFNGKTFHIHCFVCTKCHQIINNNEQFYSDQTGVLCSTCAN
jgi:hypothetical protein